MEGEEEAVLTAFAAAGGSKRALLVLAPRHPERWGAVEALIKARGFAAVRRTALPLDGTATSGDAVAVVLLDSLGELASVYGWARGSFVGGTLVPKGGHNPLEPARVGVPVAVGPSMENFREMAETFDRLAAWGRVTDAESLGVLWKGWLDRPDEARELGERALRLVLENRGAEERTLAMLAPLLPVQAQGGGKD
jgi:3-deoxy-D-manno-octulosonic-acid transferase